MWLVLFFAREADPALHDLRGYECERIVLRANNLQPKLKQLSVVLTTVDTAEQGVGRAECTEAIGDDYANGAVGREDNTTPRFATRRGKKSHLRNQRKKHNPRGWFYFLLRSALPSVTFGTKGMGDEAQNS